MSNPLPFTRGLGLLAVAALLATGCGAKGTSEGSPATTAAPGNATTIAPDPNTDPPETTTTTDPDDGQVTAADLESILPTAADIGSQFDEAPADDADDDDPDPIGDAIDGQCPDITDLGDDDEDDRVSANFEDDEGRTVTVELSPSAKERDPEELAEYLDVINECVDVTASDDQYDYIISFKASEEKALGEQAIRLASIVTISGGDLEAPLSLTNYAYNFRVGTVGARVGGSDGTVGSERAEFDATDLDPIAQDLEDRIDELLDN